MSRKELVSGIWLMIMSLLSLASCTVFYVAKMLNPPYNYFYFALSFVLIGALVIYLWGPEKLSKPARIGYRVMYACSILVIPTFGLQFLGLLSQYHAELPGIIDATEMPVEQIVPKAETAVYDTGMAYVFFPEYSSVELVCENRPSKSDETITWCSGAAFQHREALEFSHDDIEGDHAVLGMLYENPHNADGFTAFVFANGRYSFEFDDPIGAMRECAEAGGSGFMQFGLVNDGESLDVFASPPRSHCFRALAELNGGLCVIDTKRIVDYEEFIDELRRLHVTNAMYLDVGAGWNYSWYRDAAGKVFTLFGLPLPFSHNWVVFRR